MSGRGGLLVDVHCFCLLVGGRFCFFPTLFLGSVLNYADVQGEVAETRFSLAHRRCRYLCYVEPAFTDTARFVRVHVCGDLFVLNADRPQTGAHSRTRQSEVSPENVTR